MYSSKTLKIIIIFKLNIYKISTVLLKSFIIIKFVLFQDSLVSVRAPFKSVLLCFRKLNETNDILRQGRIIIAFMIRKH